MEEIQQQLGSCTEFKGLVMTPLRQTSYQEPPNTPLHIEIADVDQTTPVSQFILGLRNVFAKMPSAELHAFNRVMGQKKYVAQLSGLDNADDFDDTTLCSGGLLHSMYSTMVE